MAGTKSPAKKRFAVGAKVRVILPGVTGLVTQFDDEPTVLGEYWHKIKTQSGERHEPGSNLELISRAITNSESEAGNKMAGYDEELAQQILVALQEAFPARQSDGDLKTLPPFAAVPEEKLLLALDALLKLGMVDGKAIRAGYQSTLHAAANLEITALGRQRLAASSGTASVLASHAASRPNSKILVTISGECFEAEFLGAGDSGGRDGVLYRFRLRDLLKDRGERLVSMFRTGTERVSMENYDAGIVSVRLNVMRRAFDSSAFSFDSPVDDDRYHELRLRLSDFQPQKKADDETIRQFIKFGAYCLGFKYRPNHPNPYVDFNCPEDLDYLGVKSEDIGRNVWFLTQKGYLSSSAAFGTTLRCAPTSELIDEIEQGVKDRTIGGIVTQNIHFHGPNARLNLHSTDNSSNVVSISNDKTFVQMREAAQSVQDELEREKILAHIAELERSKGSTNFLSAYQTFISVVADHMTVFGPFIPLLTQMLSGH
jgi:hypothetical protein